MDAAKLIEVRKRRGVGVGELAGALGINRVTLWRKEQEPAEATPAFWRAYAVALRKQIRPQAQGAMADLGLVDEELEAAQIAA